MRALVLAVCLGMNLPPAVRADETLDSKRIPELVARLKERDPQTRAGAVDELGRFGPEAKAAVPALISMLADTGTYKSLYGGFSVHLYDDAFRALIEIGSEAVAGLTGALDHPSSPG